MKKYILNVIFSVLLCACMHSARAMNYSDMLNSAVSWCRSHPVTLFCAMAGFGAYVHHRVATSYAPVDASSTLFSSLPPLDLNKTYTKQLKEIVQYEHSYMPVEGSLTSRVKWVLDESAVQPLSQERLADLKQALQIKINGMQQHSQTVIVTILDFMRDYNAIQAMLEELKRGGRHDLVRAYKAQMMHDVLNKSTMDSFR